VDEGWGVIDFWESREKYDRFIEQRLQPAARELGDAALGTPSDLREFPVHNVLKP
jgi:hypothetical protein